MHTCLCVDGHHNMDTGVHNSTKGDLWVLKALTLHRWYITSKVLSVVFKEEQLDSSLGKTIAWTWTYQQINLRLPKQQNRQQIHIHSTQTIISSKLRLIILYFSCTKHNESFWARPPAEQRYCSKFYVWKPRVSLFDFINIEVLSEMMDFLLSTHPNPGSVVILST